MSPRVLARATSYAVVLGALGLGLVAPASAPAAAADKGRDAARDVVSRGNTVDTVPKRPEPERRVADIVRYRATYGDELVVTTTFRDLRASGHQDFTWFLKTSEDQFDWFVELIVQPGSNKGEFTLIDPEANQPGCGRAVLDRPRRKVTLRVPASCLGNPAWAKVSHGVKVYTDTREYADDARREGVKGSGGWKYGPQIAQ